MESAGSGRFVGAERVASDLSRRRINDEVQRRCSDRLGLGEVWIRGPQVMKGYLDNPEATNDMIDDAWLHSGDIGYADTDGGGRSTFDRLAGDMPSSPRSYFKSNRALC